MREKSIALWAALAPLLAAGLLPSAAVAADVPRLTAAYNASGQALFGALAGKPGNIVISPYSIGSAMAMARAGARGETERQMTAVLQHSLGLEATDTANAALLKILNGYAKSADAPARLRTANALMLGKRSALVSEDYRTLVSDKYDAVVREGATLEDVNGWVKKRTEGKIDRILEKLPDGAAAVLLNAVYLKAAWATPFNTEATRDEDFKLSAKETVRVPTMHQNGLLRVVERAGYRAARLSYAARRLSMIVVLPDEVDGLEAATRTLDAGELQALTAALGSGRPALVSLALPRFKTAYEASLAGPFKSAGMTLAFDDNADFSGMTGRGTGQPGLKIGDVLHRATIEVVEEGTEAAAATSVMMITRASPQKEEETPIPFVVDRPFLFYIVEDASGAVLFQGRISDPRR